MLICLFMFFYRCGIIICWKLTAATAESSSNHLPTIAGLSSIRHTSLVIPVIADSNAYHHKDLPAYGWSSGLQPKQRCFCKSVGKLQKPPISGSIMKRCKAWDLNWHSHGIEGLRTFAAAWWLNEMDPAQHVQHAESTKIPCILVILVCNCCTWTCGSTPIGLRSTKTANLGKSWLRTFWCLPATAKCSAFQPVTVPTSSKPPKAQQPGPDDAFTYRKWLMPVQMRAYV